MTNELNDSTTHRLICEYCLKVVANYSFTKTERKFLDNLKTIRCPECDMKYESWLEEQNLITSEQETNGENKK
ncbi:MAG: hypothetical protein AABY07_07470 [Nanoarchaeota archaeon]